LDTNVRPEGVVSATETPVAVLGPRLVTVTVYEMFCPARAVAGPVFVIETLVDAVTVVDAVAELFEAFRSNAVVEAAAVFEREPVKVGLIV